MKRHLIRGELYSLWLWLSGPLLWGLVGGLSAPWVLLPLVVWGVRSLAAWRLWAGRGDDEGVLLTTGDTLPTGWLRVVHLLGLVQGGVAVSVTFVAVATAFLPGLWVSYAVYLVVRVLAARRDLSAVRNIRAVLAALDGDPTGVLANPSARLDPRMMAWGHLMNGEPELAEGALAHLDPKGTITAGSDMLALLELRHGRSALLQRVLAIDPGEHLMARYRRAALLLHWDLVRGTREYVREVRDLEGELPRRHREQLEALRARVEGGHEPLPAGAAWMERVYPWLGARGEGVRLQPVDTRAVIENLFAPPDADVPAPAPSPRPTLGVFPVEWVPIVAVDRGRRMLGVAALILVVAAMFVVVEPAHAWLAALLLVPLVVLVAEGWIGSKGGVAMVDTQGALASERLPRDRIVRFSVLGALRIPALLAVVLVLCMLVGVTLGGGTAALVAPIGLFGLSLLTAPVSWRRMHPLRFAFGSGGPPDELDPLLDGEAWVGLGHLYRGQLDEAERAWSRSWHPATATLRQMLHPERLDPASLELVETAPVCWLWRVALCKTLALRYRGASLSDDDRALIEHVFTGLDDPATELLLAAVRQLDTPALRAFDAYTRRPR